MHVFTEAPKHASERDKSTLRHRGRDSLCHLRPGQSESLVHDKVGFADGVGSEEGTDREDVEGSSKAFYV
jgi:hypothetical protein